LVSHQTYFGKTQIIFIKLKKCKNYYLVADSPGGGGRRGGRCGIPRAGGNDGPDLVDDLDVVVVGGRGGDEVDDDGDGGGALGLARAAGGLGGGCRGGGGDATRHPVSGKNLIREQSRRFFPQIQIPGNCNKSTT
jgi:hypothetical protein